MSSNPKLKKVLFHLFRLTACVALCAFLAEPSALLAVKAAQKDGADGIFTIHVPSDPKKVSVTLVLPRAAYPGPLAHYVEHLSWLPNMGKDSRPFDRHTNAVTGPLTIVYWQSGDPKQLPDMLRKLATVFEPIAVPREFAEQERDIVLREYDLRMADNPDGKIGEDVNAFLYAGNPDAYSVIGKPAEIRAMTFDEAKAFHAATHRPELARLVMIGDISKKELRRAMKTAGFPALSGDRARITQPPFTLAGLESRNFAYPNHEIAPRIAWRKVVTLPAPVDYDLLVIQSRLLRNILETSLPGGLAGPLRHDNMIARAFSISITALDEDNVEIGFYGDPDTGVTFSQLQSAFETALASSAKSIPDATYKRVRERFKDYWPDWNDREKVGDWMADYTQARVQNLRQPLPENRIRKLDAKLKKQDIERLLKALAGPGRLAVATFGKDQLE
jgi:predicted Zn-dependent peptidase